MAIAHVDGAHAAHDAAWDTMKLVESRTFLEIKPEMKLCRPRAYTDGAIVALGCPSDDESTTGADSESFVDRLSLCNDKSDTESLCSWTTDNGEEDDVPCLEPCTQTQPAMMPMTLPCMTAMVPHNMMPVWNYTVQVVAPMPTFVPAVRRAATTLPTNPQLDEPIDEMQESEEMTTVIFRNIPRDCTRDMLTNTLDAEGFSSKYDFVHVPVNFQNRAGLGYALVNMVDNDAALQAREHFTGFEGWCGSTVEQEKCEVGWSSPNQGLTAHIERYRNSPMMHESVPEQCRPALFKDGKLVSFPEPTKRLRPPRVRHQKPSA